MINEKVAPAPGAKAQWTVVVLILFVLGLPILAQSQKFNVAGGPEILFWATTAIIVFLAVFHTPWIYYRLPRIVKPIVWLGLVVAFGLMLTTVQEVDEAFERTPAGAGQAAERVAREKAKSEQAAFQKQLQDTQDALDEAKRMADKLEGCFSTFTHRLPELEERVRDSLHNPSAFEHIETLAIRPDEAGNTVAMKFRAENGFGAIRTTYVLARVIPDTCAIESVTEPQS